LTEIGLLFADQAEAEAGTDNTKLMTPLRVAQSIAENAPAPAQLTQGEAEDPASTVFGTVSGQRLEQAVAANAIISKEYVSAEQTITVGGALTLNHGLGTTPKLGKVVFVCKTAEFGFAVDDEVDTTVIDSTRSTGTQFSIGVVAAYTATQVKLRFGSSFAVPLLNLSTGGNALGTPANWRLVVRAWA
jgi:hypothetical protein